MFTFNWNLIIASSFHALVFYVLIAFVDINFALTWMMFWLWMKIK